MYNMKSKNNKNIVEMDYTYDANFSWASKRKEGANGNCLTARRYIDTPQE